VGVVGVVVDGVGSEPFGDVAGVLCGLGGVLGEVAGDGRPVDEPVARELQRADVEAAGIGIAPRR
jgi:hypothetical protein